MSWLDARVCPPLLLCTSAAVMAIIGIHGPAMAMEIEGAGWGRPLDHYCERTAPGFWNEPANALSNIGFIVAAAFVLARERG